MTSPSPILETRRLTRAVRDTVLVRDVELSIYPGEVFVIVGPSGAGKSSLLRLLNRLDEPTSGTVLLGGVDYRRLDPTEVRRRVGFVPQQPVLKDGSVADNVLWGRVLRGVPREEDRMSELLDRLGLGGYEARRAAELSGGEAQRVAVARTLHNDPEVVLLDEPTASLDAAAARGLEALLLDVIRSFDLTAVMVTHDAEQARRIGTRGVRLQEGCVLRRGDVADIVEA